MTPWGDYLQQLLDARHGMSVRAFARLVGVSHVFVSRAMRAAPHGKYTVSKPPLESLDDWADKLVLTDDERARFRRLAMLEHTPDELAAEYLDLKTRVAWLEKQAEEARRRLEGR